MWTRESYAARKSWPGSLLLSPVPEAGSAYFLLGIHWESIYITICITRRWLSLAQETRWSLENHQSLILSSYKEGLKEARGLFQSHKAKLCPFFLLVWSLHSQSKGRSPDVPALDTRPYAYKCMSNTCWMMPRMNAILCSSLSAHIDTVRRTLVSSKVFSVKNSKCQLIAHSACSWWSFPARIAIKVIYLVPLRPFQAALRHFFRTGLYASSSRCRTFAVCIFVSVTSVNDQ